MKNIIEIFTKVTRIFFGGMRDILVVPETKLSF